MAVAAGEYEIGSRHAGRLLLRTFRQGVAAKAGHDLVIEATEWDGHVHVPADPAQQPSVSVRVDLGLLKVLEGTGGVKPLSEGDKQQIQQTMRKVLQVDRDPHVLFTSTGVDVQDGAAVVAGELTLAGQTHPLSLDVRQRNDNTIAGTATVVQSQWGIRPYTGFFGALKLRDAVDIEFTAWLQSG
ncbi:YceI family protein [Streptacidiphilus monticola]|uniref:YceI family protein n=1 Tax=Streptacidiphilus monticola TaxID=2161674 RepID=A0ABW1G587_9ACTN